jgi:acetoacetate decarboxylase
MAVDDDTALILGREMLGFPKKMADIELEKSTASRLLVRPITRSSPPVRRVA